MQENQTPLTAAQPANKRTVWLDKYQIPVYTDLQRADEILYATDTQLLNKPKKNYFAMVDLGEPTENVAQKKLADIPLRAVTAALPGTVAGWAVGKTQFGRGLLATGVDMGRQLGAAVLKESGSWATLAGMDTDTRLKRDGFLPGGKKETTTDTPRAAGIFPFDKDSQKYKSGWVDVEYVKERLGALKQEQTKIDDFNAKVKNITDNFLRRTGLARTQEDGFLYDFGSGASSFLFSIGMLALTRNPAMVAPLFGLMEGQGSYEQAVEAGLEPEQAYLLGKSNAAWITATEMVGEGMLNKLLFTQGVLGKGAQRILKRAEGKSFKAQTLTAGILGAAQGGGIEGTQEALQNVGSDLIMNAGKAQDKNIKDILQDALYAGLLAFPLGGMAGGVGGAANFVRFTQNVKKKLVQIGIPESKAQKLAQETALEAVSGEFVDDTLKAASGEINSPLTAARDPQAFVRQLTEAQEREIDRNAWNVGKQVEEASLKAGQDEAHAKANGTVAQALANGIYRLTKLTPKEQEHFKINILREGTPAPVADFGRTEGKGKYNFKVTNGEKAGLTQEQREHIASEIISNMEGSLFSRFKVKEIKGSAVAAQREQWKREYEEQQARKAQEQATANEEFDRKLADAGLTEKDFLLQETINKNAVDLTAPFADIAKLPADQRAQQVESSLNALIGQVMDTATPPLQIQITADNKVHIKNSNVKLKKGQLKRHQTALTTLEKIVNVAQKTDRKGEVDASHNTSKKTLAHKANVEEYVYFQAPVKIGEDTFLVELATERVKGQDKNLLDLYNVRVKRNPTAAHLSTLPQGSSTDRITNNEEFVKAQESGKTNNPSELLQENLFNIQQNPEEITEIHDQQTGEAIPLEMNPNLKPFKPVELRSDVLPRVENAREAKRQIVNSIFGEKQQIIISNDGKNFTVSRSAVKKMFNTAMKDAMDIAARNHLTLERRRALYHEASEQVLQALQVFETAQLILSHKDVKNVPGRVIHRYGNVFNYKGKPYLAMFVNKENGSFSTIHLYDLQTEENKYTAGISGVINNPSQQRYTNSIDELVRFVKRKIAKYNNNVSGKQKVFNQGEARGSVTLNEQAHEAIIRVFNQADPSTVVHELAHIYLTMINQAARVSADPEFAIFLKDLTAWLGEPGENGEYSRAQQETFARGFEGYLAEGKAPNKELEGVFAKFARWLAEVYEGVKDYLQISPEVRRVFDRLLAPEETISRSRVEDKIEAARQLVEKIKRGQGPEIDGLTVADMKVLLKTISTRKPKRPANHLLKDLRKYGAEYGNAGQIDKEAYKNARVYDKKGGIDDRPDVWLQKMGYMDFEDTTSETLQAAYDLVQKALDGAEVYRLEDQAQAENAQAYEENLNTVLQVFPDIKTAKETLSAIATLEQNGYRAVDKKDLTDLTQLVNVLGRMAAKLESEEIKAKEGALGEKANKIEEDAKRLKKRLMDELDKRQLENKEPMKNLLRAAKTTEDIHLAATALLDQLEKAWENTNEGKAEKALLAAPNTNWDKVRVDLLKRFNEIIGQTGEEIKAAQKVLNDLNGRILSEQQAQAKEKAEAVLKKANLEGRYVRAMEDAVRGLPHIYPADVRKKIAVLARSQQRYRLLTDKNITDFIGDVKKIQEANYKKYMSGKLGQLFSRKVYEKVGSAKRSKYSLLAKQFIEDGAQIWHLSEADLQTRYKEVIEHLDPNNAPDPWTALLNSVLALRAAPSLVPMKRFAEIYETALSAVRGDAQAKRLEILIAKTRESQLRLAAEVALKNRNLPAGTVAYLLRGGTDFQTMLSVLFGKGKFDKYENSQKASDKTKSEIGNKKRTGANGQVSTGSAATQTLPTFSRQDLGAVLKSIDSIANTEPVFKGAPTLEDYKNPSRDFVLPAVPAEITTQLGVENKPVLLKKNIIEKNKLHHKELPLEDYNGILERGLYTPNLVLQTNPQERPNYFNFIFEGKDKSDNVVVEIATGKDNAEVVSFYRLDKDKLDKKIKRTNRNGGQAVKTHMRGPSPIRTPSVDSTNSIANTEPVFKGGREQYEIDFRKELSPEGEQMQAAVFDFNAKKAIFKAALDAYGLETADQVLAKMYELQNDKMQITNYGWVKDEQEGGLVDRIWQNGTAYTNNRPRVQTITREELITFWLWSQDHEIVEGKDGKAQDLGLCGRLLRAYGKDQLNAMLDKLSPQDKQYGRNLQKILADVHTMESEAHQRIYGFPLPQKENYFPSVTERITDAIDYKQQFIDNAKAPSFIKSRTLSKMPVQAICSPTQLVLTHMKRASEFIFEAEKYTRLRRIFLQSDMESTFLDKFGDSDGKKLFDKLKDLIAQQGPTAAKPSGELWAMSNKLLNGWVKSALGLKVMTGVKQFASCVSFAEVMPADKWLKYFAYGLAHPMETAQYMKAQSPYIEVRYETGGLNEAVARAMAQDELAPIKTKWNNLTNLLLLNTRMGDKASLIFGGYPYMRYLQEQGISGQEAARLFELQAVRTLQSSLKANLSMGQANGDNFAARLFMLFKNQQLQYVRRLADVYVQYKNGEVPLKQLGKTALLYLAVNPLVYVMLGIGWPSADDDDREKDFFRLASAPVTQFFDAWPFGGGVSEFLLENTCNVIRGKKLASASQAGMPMLEDFVRDINRAIKTVNQDDIPATEAVAAWLEFAKYFGIPFGTLTNMASGAKDLVTGHPVRGALKELGFSKNRAGKITGEKE